MENVVKVQMDGIQPHVEAIMWEVLKAVQLRANKTGAEFLLTT